MTLPKDRSSAQTWSFGPQMQNNRTKLSTHFFMANRELGACRGVVFNLFVCFGPVLITAFPELLASLPLPLCKTFQTLLCLSPLSLYLFNSWKEPKGVPNVPLPRRASFSTGQGKRYQSSSTLKEKKEQEKRGRVKVGSGVGGKSLGWIRRISSSPPWLLKGGFFGHLPRHMPG